MPAVPVAPDIRDGNVPSSLWNQFRDAINFTQNPPQFDLRQTVVQSLTNITDTPISMDTEDGDDDIDGIGGHDAGTPTLWICRYPGRYLLHGKVGFVANATGIRVAWIQVNGIDISGSGNVISGSAAFDPPVATNPKKVPLDTGDQVRLMGYQSSTIALNTYVALTRYQSVLSGLWVGIR